MEYHARSWYDTPLRFFLPDVHVGDTLRFMYHGSVDIAPTNVGGGGGGFGVDMILPEDVCYTYWEGELHEREVCSIGMYIMYPDTAGFRLVTEKDTVSYREASAVRAIAVSSDGGEVQIDSTTMIRYTMVPDTLGSFISAAAETVTTVDARYADARAGRIKFVANKSKPDSVRPVVINVVQISDTTKRGSKTLYLKSASNDTILLGETKYFQAKEDPSNSNQIVLQGYSTPQSQGLTAVNFVISPIVGSRVGAYYESRDEEGGILPTDQIRLVGRFWAPDTTFKVRLTATHSGRSVSREITVLKPHSLGTSYRTTRDVRDSVVNIDSICIFVGGKNGIPPQLIKGQMQRESKIASFGFAPSYRFEPFNEETGQFQIHDNEKWTDNQAYVTVSGMGTVAVPQHQNVRDIDYPTTPRRVWYFLEQHSDLVTPSPQIRMYGKRLPNGRMDFAYANYKTIQQKYDGYFKKIRTTNQQLADTTVAARARDSLIVELRDHLKLDSMWAQTRLASSYGLLQMTFVVANERGYPKNNPSYPPERLNENDVFFSLVLTHQTKLLKKVLGSDYNRSGNWTRSFSDRMHELMRQWNGARIYADSVVYFSGNYPPIRH